MNIDKKRGDAIGLYIMAVFATSLFIGGPVMAIISWNRGQNNKRWDNLEQSYPALQESLAKMRDDCHIHSCDVKHFINEAPQKLQAAVFEEGLSFSKGYNVLKQHIAMENDEAIEAIAKEADLLEAKYFGKGQSDVFNLQKKQSALSVLEVL